ncbi:hypothetical protein [Emticicia agri]|uniref:Uncharacterized protein n=1 Tax=Emticicia agri TaxID=2492393 RepID=A0A4Q5M0P6_9BACT|nr:hypothetical protein [Emticicia agri]RYU95771.1 hypothetical protein EWM59_10435 [Emticicia agri]
MKVFFTISLLLVCACHAMAQKKCSCKDYIEKVYDCNPIKLKTGSKLYWNYTCDSVWFTFENKYKKKRIIYSSTLIDPRIGYTLEVEYERLFLIRHEIISGCCTPPIFFAHDSRTGKLLKDYGKILYFSEKANDPLIVKFKDSDYEKMYSGKPLDLSIQVINPVTGKTVTIPSNQKQLNAIGVAIKALSPEQIISQVIVNAKTITIIYPLSEKKDAKTQKIIINRGKYAI